MNAPTPRHISSRCRPLAAVVAALVVAVCVSQPATALARVRLESLCTVQGQEEVTLTGLGLVVGLPGTGDGARNLPTVRALQAALAKMNQPIGDRDIKNADSVAVVLVEATVPKTGVRRGQRIDVQLSAIMGAKSLRGGRLLSAPLTSPLVRKEVAVAMANGAIGVEDPLRPSVGKIQAGASLLEDVTPRFVDEKNGYRVTLLLDPAHASFWTSSEAARVINAEFSFESSGQLVARSVSPGIVELTVPRQYRDSPVEFVAQVLEVGIDVPHTQARVVINSRTGTVVVTGEVELSPVVITHKNFSLEVGTEELLAKPFTEIPGNATRQSPQQLADLVNALNQLRVPTADIIDIIRELHASGKLHAELIDR